MPVSSITSSGQQAVAVSHTPREAIVPSPQGIGNLPLTGKPGVGRGSIELPLAGVAKEDLQRLEKMLGGRALTDSELARLITGDFGRTPMGTAMARHLAGDALDALRNGLPWTSEDERKVWQAVVEDAIKMPLESWHMQHANPPTALLRPGMSETLKVLYKLLHASAPGCTSWKDVFPAKPTVSARIRTLERISRNATLDTSALGRNGMGKPWIAAALGSLVLAAGIPAGRAEFVAEETDGADAQLPLLRQHLAHVATPVVRCFAPLGTLIARYPRTMVATVAGTIVAGIVTAVYDRFGRPGDAAASPEALPFALLAGAVGPDILANVVDEVRRGDASLDVDARALQAVRALGPAAEGIRTMWEIARHGRSDRLEFMTPGLDIEFGEWLIKQVYGEPIPSGGIDMTWSDWTLPNGLRVLLVPGKGDVASVQLRFGDGGSIEREGQHGAVHFAEHLWFRRDLPDGRRFDDIFAAAGVTHNAYTNRDTTVYYAEGAVEALPLILFEKSYRLAHATDPLPLDHFETERNVVLNEVRQRDSVASRAYGVMARTMYRYGHPYHTSVGGRPRDLLSLQASDMENFMRARQRPNLATLVISGNVDEDHVRGLVTEYFAGIEPGNAFPPRTPDIQPRTVDTNDEMFDSVTMPRLYRAWNVPQDGHADLPALMLCADVLTHRLKDALSNEIVFGVAYVEPRELGSQFHIALYLRDDIDQGWVEDTLNSVSRTFLAGGPTEDELDSARRALISRSGQAQASSDAIATAVVHCVDKGGDPDCLNVDVQAWHEATPAGVRDVANQWLTQGSHTQLVTSDRRAQSSPEVSEPARNVPWDTGVPDPGLRATPTGTDHTLLPPMPPPRPVTFPAVSRTELPNGLPLVLAPMHKGGRARVVFSFDGGRMGELDTDIGLGAANLALRVVTQRAGALERNALKEKLGDLDLTITARSKEGYSTIILEGPPAKLAEGAQIVRDMLLDTRFPADLLDQSRARASATIGRVKAEPGLRGSILMNQLVLGERHPYGFDPLGEGTEASLAAMTPGQVARWAQRYLHPSNATIVAVGPFQSGELSSGLALSFGAVDGARERSRAVVPVLAQSAHPGMYVLPIAEGRQSHVMLGYPVPRGGSMDEVLHECIERIIQRRVKRTLREQEGLTYGLYPLATATRGVRIGGFTTAAANADGIEALAAAWRVVSDLLEGRTPVTQEELDLHLLYQRRVLATRLEDPLEVESALVETVDLQSHDARIDEAARVMEGLTSDEVNEALRRMSMNHLTWILAGPSAGGADPSVSSETDGQGNEDVELRLRLTAMGLSHFTAVDPVTGTRTVHQL
jgi:predicted Zn-dependent peptidase